MLKPFKDNLHDATTILVKPQLQSGLVCLIAIYSLR